jgi:hypothetical protein
MIPTQKNELKQIQQKGPPLQQVTKKKIYLQPTGDELRNAYKV